MIALNQDYPPDERTALLGKLGFFRWEYLLDSQLIGNLKRFELANGCQESRHRPLMQATHAQTSYYILLGLSA